MAELNLQFAFADLEAAHLVQVMNKRVKILGQVSMPKIIEAVQLVSGTRGVRMSYPPSADVEWFEVELGVSPDALTDTGNNIVYDSEAWLSSGMTLLFRV